VGLPCRITLRDGSRPDIVLQPDLQIAHRAFAAVWQAMAAALRHDLAAAPRQGMAAAPRQDDQAFPLTAFSFGLHPRTGGGEMPFLCWRDGLLLAAPAPHDPDAVARTLAACGHAMAATIGLAPGLASVFGAACGYLLAGVPAGPDGQEASDLVTLYLPITEPPLVTISNVMDATFWDLAAPLLTATVELFAGWTADPSSHATLRAAWRRGRSIEMSGD
jgi:hypothetical protein